ncbi:MAG TPA: hypothetical protein VGE13_02615 [Candidatus Saccharimonadales bacterium]
MKRFKNIVFAALAVIVAASYGVPSLPASAVSSASLSIVPKKSYTISPGKSVKDTLVIRNLDRDVPLSLNLRVIDFTYTDDGGTPKLMLDEDAPQTTWSLKPFLTVPKTVTIPPLESRTLNMSVAIPAGHGAGSYYSAIVYSSGSSDGGNVGLSASGVTLVFTQIPGKVKEDLKLEQFGAYKTQTQTSKAGYTFFATDEPQVMAYTLKNGGNVTEAPSGSITIRGLFGNERVIGDVNPNSSLALIGQTRTFTSCIQLDAQEVEFSGTKTKTHKCVSPGLWPGFYTASLDLYYGQNGNATHEVKGTASFLYLPWWFILVALIVILAVSYYIWKIYNAIRAKFGIRPRSSSRRRR